jgi:hypothetical protein
VCVCVRVCDIAIHAYALVRSRYLQTWFIVDLTACLPITYISLWSNGPENGAGSNIRAFKALRLCRLSKMLQLSRMQVCATNDTRHFSGNCCGNYPGILAISRKRVERFGGLDYQVLVKRAMMTFDLPGLVTAFRLGIR